MRKSSALSRLLKYLLPAVAGGCFLCSPAFAALVTINVTVDENGNNIATTSTGITVTQTGILRPDPGPGGLPSVLSYLSFSTSPFVEGDVLMQDGVGGPTLDVIRFAGAGPSGLAAFPFGVKLFFYSDNLDGLDSLGDTVSPPGALFTNNLTILEVGTEGNNGAFYTPVAGQPGFTADFQFSYHFISDGSAVPEPSTVVLVGSMLMMLVVIIGKRRRASL